LWVWFGGSWSWKDSGFVRGLDGVVERIDVDEALRFGEIEVVVGGVADGDHLVGVSS
jgi:hypothetical protein